MKKLLPDIIAILAFVVISFVYFFPADIEGRILFQHDSAAGAGAGRDAQEYFERTGERSRWTNSIFGGMPTYQMAPSYDSTKSLSWVEKTYQLYLPDYVVLTFIMMLGFYILLRAFGISAWLAGFGGIIWAFSSYFFILIPAGHIWKFVTIGLHSAYDCRDCPGLSKEVSVGRNNYGFVYSSSDSFQSHTDELLFHVCDSVYYRSLLRRSL